MICSDSVGDGGLVVVLNGQVAVEEAVAIDMKESSPWPLLKELLG